jgi:hypothetical protein
MDTIAGFLILTIYEPRRRWYGKLMSKMTVESGVPFSNGTEIRHVLLEGWIHPQPTYFEHKIPATILEH